MVTPAAVAGPPGGKPSRTHRSLVEATRAEIEASGGRFGAEGVAARAGMAPATFYSYFPSKDDALAAALDDVLAELVVGTFRELTVETLLEHGLEDVVDQTIHATLGLFRTSAVVLRVALARLPEHRGIRSVYRHHQQVAEEAIERFVRLGAAAGKLTADEPRVVALTLLVLFQGFNNPLLLQRVPDEAVIDHLAHVVVDLLRP